MAFGLFQGITGGSDFYGSKPIVPDVAEAQQKTIRANLAAITPSKQVARGVNVFQQGELQRMLKNIPGYQDLYDQTRQLISSQLRGELPSDVQDLIKRSTAEKAVAGGYAGSQFGRNLTARDLGLTSLQLTQQGLDSASRWMASSIATQMPERFDVSSMFVPVEMQFGRDWLQSQIEAAPDPVQRGRFDTEMEILGMALSAYSGGSGYKSTYKPSYSEGPSGGWGYGAGSKGNELMETNTMYA